MIELKPGVRLNGVRAEVFHGVHVAEALWALVGVPILVITSGIEGQHSQGSGHYRGCAVDLRTNSLPPDKATSTVAKLAQALGPDYFILYEGEGTPSAHCHLEFKPKEAY